MLLKSFLLNFSPLLSEWGLYGMGSLTFPFQQTGDEYLNAAERDLQHQDNSGNINALTNAKRAIDCQLEALITKFGLPKKKNFPERTDQLRGIGLVAPRILEKVNRTRNFLEHQFHVPDRAATEDAVDIATLFVKMTDSIFYNFYGQVEFYQPDTERGPMLRLDWSEGNCGFDAFFGEINFGNYTDGDLYCEQIRPAHELHMNIIHLFVALRTSQEDPIALFRSIVLDRLR